MDISRSNAIHQRNTHFSFFHVFQNTLSSIPTLPLSHSPYGTSLFLCTRSVPLELFDINAALRRLFQPLTKRIKHYRQGHLRSAIARTFCRFSISAWEQSINSLSASPRDRKLIILVTV